MTALDLAGVRQAAAECTLIGVGDAQIEFHERIGSTNDRIQELAKQGASEGTLVVAAVQEDGRGRLGKVWSSPSGGLYLSILLRPDQAMLRRLPATLLGALALAEAIEFCSDQVPQLKWPNDVQIGGRKVAGILGELSRDEKGSLLVLGIGVNVSTPLADLPEELRDIATSLAAASEAGAPAPGELLRSLLTRFEEHYLTVRRGGGASILSSASSRMPMLGKEIRVRLPERTVTGIASGLNQTGGLVVEHGDDARREVFVAGEVEEVRSQ